MVLSVGARLGPYLVLSPLGVGGMGEVYRARDTTLDREVALKVVRTSLTDDPDRRRRFTREARLLAQLSHPNVAQVYGVEESSDGQVLVMELVEGLTLADRIGPGPLPFDEALPLAAQIAAALEAAHEQGIIHRDLKPANVKVRPDGLVKVLDFGLAKALDRDSGPAQDEQAELQTARPTETMDGVVLGTPAYMSPEQARGRPVDRRADLWAFGCVVFEMLAGRRPFGGDTTSDVLAKILEAQPEWNALPAATPAALRRLLRRCLEKNPKARLDSAASARLEVEEAMRAVAGTSSDAAPPAQPARAKRRLLHSGIGAVAAALIGAVAAWIAIRPLPQQDAPPTRFGLVLAPARALALSLNDRDLSVSADGQRLVYTAGADAQIMVREFAELAARPLSGITDARAPILSPDGRWVGFFSRIEEGLDTGPVVAGSLRKASLTGGPPVIVCQLTGSSRGASWTPDETIVFATNDPSTGLLRVSSGGGEPAVLTTPDAAKGERDHFYPAVLPGGRAALFTLVRSSGAREIAVLDLATGEYRTVIRDGTQAEYADTGHLVYVAGDALWAVGFDLEALTIHGDATPVIERLRTAGAANFGLSSRGTLVYAPRRVTATGELALTWVDRRGRLEPIAAPLRRYSFPRLSPDGTRIAVRVADEQSHLWIFHLVRQTLTRLTDNGPTFMAVWTPDGRSIVFNRDLASRLFRRPADRPGADEPLLAADGGARIPTSVSPDGTRLVYHEYITQNGAPDLMTLRLDGTARVEPLVQTPADERDGEISPDGRWLAYDSTVSGRAEIYVRPFPNVNDGFVQVSTDGGRTPVWSPDGRALFFVSGSRMMAAAVSTTPVFAAERTTVLFDDPSLLLDARSFSTGAHRTFDVSRDGQRFLVLKDSRSTDDDTVAAGMIVVQNWFTELRRQVPTP
jgi:eukaryotic-like serine/threonine-protein kinase